MENQPQNPEFRNNPENFHPCILQKLRRLKREDRAIKELMATCIAFWHDHWHVIFSCIEGKVEIICCFTCFINRIHNLCMHFHLHLRSKCINNLKHRT